MVPAFLHVDLDAFFCSVEVLRRPELKNKPIVVGGSPEKRGVVAAASYPARTYGIHSAMPMAQAVRLCPELIIVPHHFGLYKTYSRVVMGFLKSQPARFLPVSIDEATLDFSDTVKEWEDLIEYGRRIQQTIIRDIRLPVSLGLGTSRMIAKIASDRDKPEGFTVIRPGEEQAFLDPLPVRVIPGIGPKTAATLERYGIRTVREMRDHRETDYRRWFGKWGAAMWAWAHGRDAGPRGDRDRIKSVSRERTFPADISASARLIPVLESLCKSISKQLQEEGLLAGSVSLKLRHSSFQTRTRQTVMQPPKNDARSLLQVATSLLALHYTEGEPLRLIGVAAGRLCPRSGQIDLFP